VSGNLANIAGEWAGFDQAWLTQRCQANALRRSSLFHRTRLRLQAPMLWLITFRYWRRVIPRMRALRSDAAQTGGPTC
jgi:hypothetical protein